MSIASAIQKIYETFDGPGDHFNYHERHRTTTLNVLTVSNPEEAAEVVVPFREAIKGRTVIEIGAGVGFLALEMAKHAKFVWAVEVDPGWSWTFLKYLYASKPANMSWVFGSADCLVGRVTADVTVLRTRSGVRRLIELAGKFSPLIVLSSCAEPVIADRLNPIFDEITEYIERRTTELMREAVDAFNSFDPTPPK